MKNEIWKNICGYNGLYQISNLGRIKSLKRKNRKHEIIRKKQINKFGYEVIELKKNGVGKQFRISRLVAINFINNFKNKKEINHKDGNKTNNKVENLEWCSRQENEKHCWDNGLKNFDGENHYKAKFKINDIKKIRSSISESNKTLSEKYNVNWSTIRDIRNYRTWKHI